jgi:hypothetical protein
MEGRLEELVCHSRLSVDFLLIMPLLACDSINRTNHRQAEQHPIESETRVRKKGTGSDVVLVANTNNCLVHSGDRRI